MSETKLASMYTEARNAPTRPAEYGLTKTLHSQ
jgi:hypothetical protein